MSHSDKYCFNMKITHGQPWSYLPQRRIATTIVSIFKSIPLGSPIPLVYNFLGNGFRLGSPIPLVYNIKPLGLLFLLVYKPNKPLGLLVLFVYYFFWFINPILSQYENHPWPTMVIVSPTSHCDNNCLNV